MDSVVGDDVTLPIDINGSCRLPDSINAGEFSADSMTAPPFSDKMSPIKALTMKDYENQITALKKENFNLKLRIYFMEERMQQKCDDSTEDVFKTNIELKVELESMKRELAEKQELLVCASKALESLAGRESGEPQRVREQAQKEMESLRVAFSARIADLEQCLRAAEEEVEKMAAIAEQEKLRNIDTEKQLQALNPSSTLTSAPAPGAVAQLQRTLQDQDEIIQRLRISLKEREAGIRQDSRASPTGDRLKELTDLVARRDQDLQALRDELHREKDKPQPDRQSDISRLESINKLLSEELSQTKSTNENLTKTLEDSQNHNKTLSGTLEEKENELNSEKKNALKRDKTIQGLTQVLREKEKEILELCHEIEDRDDALSKAREAAHKAQLQKYQGVEEHQNLLMEKQTELAQLQGEHHTKVLEAQKLQRALDRKEQELLDLQQAKEQLEVELEDLQQQKKKGDKALNDMNNQLKKLGGEIGERESALEHQYQELLDQTKRRLQAHEVTVQRLTSTLADKEQQLQEYVNALRDFEHSRSPGSSDGMLSKLRQRLKDKEKALERALDEKFAAVEEKDNEIHELQLSLRERERDLDRLNKLLGHHEETMENFDGAIKEKDAELQQLANTLKNLQRAKQDVEDNLRRSLREKDAIIGQLQRSLDGKTKDMEEMSASLLSQSQSRARDLAEQTGQRLKVTEAMLAEAVKARERLVADNEGAVEGLLATISSKDQLLKESAEHYKRLLSERSREVQEARRRLSDRQQQLSAAEKQSSTVAQEGHLQTAELRALLAEKDGLIDKLLRRGQERDQFLAEMRLKAEPDGVVELKHAIQIMQEKPDEREAELSRRNSEDNTENLPLPRKTVAVLKKELAQKTEALNKALKRENELKIALAELRSLASELEGRDEGQAANIESLTATLAAKEEIISELRQRLGQRGDSRPDHARHAIGLDRSLPGLPQRESTMIGGDSQQDAFPKLAALQQEHDALNKALRAEQQLYSNLVRTVKEQDSAQRLHALQLELTAVQLLRQQLEDGVGANEELRDDLERELRRAKLREGMDLNDPKELERMRHQLEDAQRWNASLQARLGAIQNRGGGVGGANDGGETSSFLGDQTSYLSFCVGEGQDHGLSGLSAQELGEKVVELQDRVGRLQALNAELHARLSQMENLERGDDDEDDDEDLAKSKQQLGKTQQKRPLARRTTADQGEEGNMAVGPEEVLSGKRSGNGGMGVDYSLDAGEKDSRERNGDLTAMKVLLTDCGLASIPHLRAELLRLRSDNAALRGLLKEQESARLKEKESADASGDSSEGQPETRRSLETLQPDARDDRNAARPPKKREEGDLSEAPAVADGAEDEAASPTTREPQCSSPRRRVAKHRAGGKSRLPVPVRLRAEAGGVRQTEADGRQRLSSDENYESDQTAAESHSSSSARQNRSPPTALGSPPATLGSPPAALGSPLAALGSPPAALGSPLATLGSPPAALGSPPAALGSPPATLGSPPTALGSLPTALGSPPATLGSPLATLGSPLAALGSPPAALGSPLATLGSPLAALGSPLAALGSPPAALGSPLAALGSPPATLGSLPTALGSPLAALGSPPATLGSAHRSGSPVEPDKDSTWVDPTQSAAELLAQLELLHQECQEKGALISELSERLSGWDQLRARVREKERLVGQYEEALQAAESTIAYLTACSLDSQGGFGSRAAGPGVLARCLELQEVLQEKEALNQRLVELLNAAGNAVACWAQQEGSAAGAELRSRIQEALEQASAPSRRTGPGGASGGGGGALRELRRRADSLQEALREQNGLDAESRGKARATEPAAGSAAAAADEDPRERRGSAGGASGDAVEVLLRCWAAAECAVASLAAHCANTGAPLSGGTQISSDLDKLQRALVTKERLWESSRPPTEPSSSRPARGQKLHQHLCLLHQALAESSQRVRELQEERRRRGESEVHRTPQDARALPPSVQAQLEALHKELREKKKACKNLEEKLTTALTGTSSPETARTAPEQDDKGVQVDLQDLGYETSGKSENDREESSSTDLEVGANPCRSASSLPSLLKQEQAAFSSTENLDSSSSTPYPSSPALSSAKVSLKSLQAYDGYGVSDDPLQLQGQVRELKVQLENQTRLILQMQNLLRRSSLASDPAAGTSDPVGDPDAPRRGHGGGPLGERKEGENQALKNTSYLNMDCEGGKTVNRSPGDQLQQGRSRSTSPARLDSLVKSQARELSQLRQQVKESRRLGGLQRGQLEELNKAFRELLQGSGVDHCMGEVVKEQLDKSLSILDRLEGRLDKGESHLDNEDVAALELSRSLGLVGEPHQAPPPPDSPSSIQRDLDNLRLELEGERELLQLHVSLLVRQNLSLAECTREQLDLLAKELQEKNRLIQSLQSQIRVQSLGGSDRTSSSSCHSSPTAPPAGRSHRQPADWTGAPVGGVRDDGGGASGGRDAAGRLQRENGRLQERLRGSEELSASLRSELDLHRSIMAQTGARLPGLDRSLDRVQDQDSGLQSETQKEDGESPKVAGEQSRGVNPDLLAEHLQEIRALRRRLEESIRTNDRLRERLEARLAEVETPDAAAAAATNIFIHGGEKQDQLASELRFLWGQNQALKEQLSLGSRDKQKENEKLRESLSRRTAKLEQSRTECEALREENGRLAERLELIGRENSQLQEELHRLQSDVKLQRQQLCDSQRLLQSLRLELQVHEKMKTTESDKHDERRDAAPHPAVPAGGGGDGGDGGGSLDLSELLQEIRRLRLQLERSIRTNTALRQRLEEQLLRGPRRPDTININYLLSSPDEGGRSPGREGFDPHQHSFQARSERSRLQRESDGGSLSSSSGDSASAPPSRLVPGHRLWASRAGRHVLGLIEDHEALRKQISEGRRLSRSMDAQLQDSLRALRQHDTQVPEQQPLQTLSGSVNAMQQVLEEAGRLLKLVWRVSLPAGDPAGAGGAGGAGDQQGELLTREMGRLKSRLWQQERTLSGAVERLRTSNQLKEGMERVIIQQLSLTHGVLKKARGNLEANYCSLSGLKGPGGGAAAGGAGQRAVAERRPELGGARSDSSGSY